MNGELDATRALEAACKKHGIDLRILIAETALWAHPEVCKALLKTSGSVCFFPRTRRCRENKGEKRGVILDGIRMDDNTYANHAIKQALGVGRDAKGFEVCHVWPGSCYDADCHTAIPNLVLIPRPLAGLTDHSSEIQTSLQYRSFELYGWHPKGSTQPVRPAGYPKAWRLPFPFTERVAKSIANRKAKLPELAPNIG